LNIVNVVTKLAPIALAFQRAPDEPTNEEWLAALQAGALLLSSFSNTNPNPSEGN
jgi:hypothetical protein